MSYEYPEPPIERMGAPWNDLEFSLLQAGFISAGDASWPEAQMRAIDVLARYGMTQAFSEVCASKEDLGDEAIYVAGYLLPLVCIALLRKADPSVGGQIESQFIEYMGYRLKVRQQSFEHNQKLQDRRESEDRLNISKRTQTGFCGLFRSFWVNCKRFTK